MRKVYLIIALLLIIAPLIGAESFQQGTSRDFVHIVTIDGFRDDSILTNITIKDSDGIILVGYQPMSYNVANKTFNYTIPASQTQKVGTYERCLSAVRSGLNETECFEFQITPSGSERINSGESLTLIGGSAVMLLVGVLFFIMFLKVNNTVARVGLLASSVIILFMSVLFTTVTIQQTLGGFSNILAGYETFLFVMKTLMTVGIVVFFVFVLLFMVRAWKIKRGLLDV